MKSVQKPTVQNMRALVKMLLVVSMLLFGCDEEPGQQPIEQQLQQDEIVIAWAKQLGMRIDDWQVGGVPGEGFDFENWKQEGCSIANAEEIVQTLLQENDGRIEPVLLVQALGAVGTSKSVPLLQEELEDDWDVMRQTAVWALGQIGGDEVLTPLAQQLNYGRTSGIRLEAASSLVEVGSERGIKIMEGAIGDAEYELGRIRQALAELRQRVDREQEVSSRTSTQ